MENLVCGEQGHETPSRNIVDLIDNHTDDKVSLFRMWKRGLHSPGI